MDESILEELLNQNDIIMIDTCFAMRDEFPDFIDGVEVELMAHKQKIKVKSVVMAELYRHMGSRDEKLRSKATRAVETICMKRNIFDIDEKQMSAEAIFKSFADVEFIADFTKERIKYRMALLTNDYKLGKDIKDLNNLESCYGKEVEVFALNSCGILEERTYNESKVISVEKEPDRKVEEQEVKMNWTSLILPTVASFMMGVFIDRHGKHIYDSVIKAIA